MSIVNLILHKPIMSYIVRNLTELTTVEGTLVRLKSNSRISRGIMPNSKVYYISSVYANGSIRVKSIERYDTISVVRKASNFESVFDNHPYNNSFRYYPLNEMHSKDPRPQDFFYQINYHYTSLGENQKSQLKAMYAMQTKDEPFSL